jgi:hypothetical protein
VIALDMYDDPAEVRPYLVWIITAIVDSGSFGPVRGAK